MMNEKKLADVLEITSSRRIFACDYCEDGIPFFRGKEITEKYLGNDKVSTELFISRKKFNDIKIKFGVPCDGDILLTSVGTLGSVYQVKKGDEFYFKDGNITWFKKFSHDINSKFVYYWLISKDTQNKLNKIAIGTTQKALTIVNLKNIIIKYPSLYEQNVIVHILETLDDKIELNRHQNTTLEAMAQAIFKDWFVDFGPVRAKMEGRHPEGMSREIADLFPDSLDDEGKPEGWEWKPLSCFFELLGGGTPKTSVDEYWNGEIPWFCVVDTPSGSDLFVVNTQKNITKYGFENSSVQMVPQNCTIITARGTVGKLALTAVPMTINQSCYAAKAKKYIGNFFIYFLLRKSISNLESNAHGSVFSTITRSTFETIYSDYPTQSLCIAFEESVFPLMEKIKKNVLEVNTLASLRDTLLPKLISGELRVPDAEKMVADLV